MMYMKELINSGAPARTRTADLLITNQLLYQLSYKGADFFYKNLITNQDFFLPCLYEKKQQRHYLQYLNFQFFHLF